MFSQVRKKYEFDFLKIQQLEVEIEENRILAPVENGQKGQREGNRRHMCFSRRERGGRGGTEIRGRGAAPWLDGVPRIHLPHASCPTEL